MRFYRHKYSYPFSLSVNFFIDVAVLKFVLYSPKSASFRCMQINSLISSHVTSYLYYFFFFCRAGNSCASVGRILFKLRDN